MYDHYDKSYFSWQKKSGILAGQLDLWKFQPYIKKTDRVLDFGCGGGYILKNLTCRARYGVDINPVVRREAEAQGIKMYATVYDIPRSIKFDVVISHHTLEHLDNPAEILRELKKRTRRGGRAIHVLPVNDWRNDRVYNPRDINKHLYTWTPLLAGNIFAHCGYKVRRVELITHAWFPLSIHYYRYIPQSLMPVYHAACRVWAFTRRARQIRVIASV